MENYNIFTDYNSVLFKEECARGTRQLYELGYSPTGDSGDISVRDPKSGLIYISGSPDWCTQKNLGDARGWERAIVDLEGNELVPWTGPTCEMPMHLAIYRARPDVGAVVHTHGEWASIFSLVGYDIPLVLAGQGESGVIRCSTCGKAGTEETARTVTEALGDGKAAIIRNHGAVAVADTLDNAYAVAAWLEAVAQKAYFTLLLSGEHRVDYDAVVAQYSK